MKQHFYDDDLIIYLNNKENSKSVDKLFTRKLCASLKQLEIVPKGKIDERLKVF